MLTPEESATIEERKRLGAIRAKEVWDLVALAAVVGKLSSSTEGWTWRRSLSLPSGAVATIWGGYQEQARVRVVFGERVVLRSEWNGGTLYCNGYIPGAWEDGLPTLVAEMKALALTVEESRNRTIAAKQRAETLAPWGLEVLDAD